MADTPRDRHELTAISPQHLQLGEALRFTLRDASGRVLLAKGLRIENQEALEALQRRPHVYVGYDEAVEAHKVLMSGLSELSRRDAPLKDIDKYVSLKSNEPLEVLEGSLPQVWSELESKLKLVLGSLALGGEAAVEVPKRLSQCADHMDNLLARDREASLYLLMHQAVTGFSGYSVLHALLCAVVCRLLAEPLKLPVPESDALVRAALTMNSAMTVLQDVLAAQKQRPSPGQQAEIEAHPELAVRLLQAAGVNDRWWLDAVKYHHRTLRTGVSLAERAPGERITKVLQTVDRYTAAMSPRVSRSGRDARDAARAAIVQPGAGQHDEVGMALVAVLGLHPAGTFVKLVNGETAVVLRRGAKPNEPFVASVLNRRDDPIAEPRLHATAKPEFAVQQGVAAAVVRVRLNTEVMLKQLAYSKTGSDRTSGLG